MRVVELYFMLTFSEAIFAQIKTQYKTQIRTALDECWSFLENKNKSGKDLYILLDDGTDFNGIFIYMQLDKFIMINENIFSILIWNQSENFNLVFILPLNQAD